MTFSRHDERRSVMIRSHAEPFIPSLQRETTSRCPSGAGNSQAGLSALLIRAYGSDTIKMP